MDQKCAVIYLSAVIHGSLCLFRNEMACIYLYYTNIHGPTVRLQILFISTVFKTVTGIVVLMFDYYKL